MRFSHVIIQRISTNTYCSLTTARYTIRLQDRPEDSSRINIKIRTSSLRLFITTNYHGQKSMHLRHTFTRAIHFNSLTSGIVNRMRHTQEISHRRHLDLIFHILQHSRRVNTRAFPRTIRPIIRIRKGRHTSVRHRDRRSSRGSGHQDTR